MNVYDTATPAGRTPRQGHVPRVRKAAPGSGLDGVFASRYLLLGSEEVADGVRVDVLADQDTDPPPLTDEDAAAVAVAIGDETPPDARPPRLATGGMVTDPGLVIIGDGPEHVRPPRKPRPPKE